MKTVVDAVNVLNGDIELGVTAVYCGRILDFVVSTSLYPWEDNFDVKFLDGTSAQFSCDEFNQCAAEMTEGLFVPLSDLNKRKASGEAEQKTVEHDGMAYEIGKVYEFQYDDEDCWHTGTLKLVRDGESAKFESTSDFFHRIRECQSQLGTITKAPLVLEDGAAYQFDYQNELNIIGIAQTKVKFDRIHKMLCTAVGETGYNAEYCTNIIKLVPDVSAENNDFGRLGTMGGDGGRSGCGTMPWEVK